MKKYAFILLASAVVVGCKKPPVGSNKGVLKLEPGVERYDTHETRTGGVHDQSHGGHGEAAAHKTEVKVDVNGTELHAYQGGLEEQMVHFLKSDGYNKAADDSSLKDVWYNFDNVNFKMGSATELEAGSADQISNLAAILKAYPTAKIKIGGYTDKTGNEAANVKLSLDRANFIKSELSKLGVGAQILGAEGYGSKFAKVDAKASDEERAADRKMAVRFAK